jgi:hypothetical protein
MLSWREHMIMRRPYSRLATRRAHRFKIREKPPATAGQVKRQAKLAV